MRFRNLVFFALVATVMGCTSPQATGGQCSFNADCATGLVCADSLCRTACSANGTCPDGMRCNSIAGTSISFCTVVTEEPRCTYSSECPGGLVCNRDGRCRPECRTNYDCRVLNPFTTCVEGTCALVCAPNTADCDGLVRNGCETNTSRSTAHCGACGNACRAGANQSVACTTGRCVASCNPGFADCDGDASNGCEADLSTPATCGACGTRCEAPRSLCQSGQDGARACVSSCSGATPMECAGRCVNPQADLAHCGACGNACAAGPNATARCVSGRCGLTCAQGFADCDGNAANGCEESLQASLAHCGACGNACAMGPNSTASCDAGRCRLTCAEGFGDCDGNAANGCEVDLRTSTANCGACGRSCALMGATASCSAGACSVAQCNAGFADCDENATNGCETNLSTLTNCRACRAVCGSANAAPVCGAEGCELRCNQGFADCDERKENGCEASLSSLTNCRGCGNVCGTTNASATCGSEGCVLRCNQGFGDCDGNAANGCEADLARTDAHCGACGNSCAAVSSSSGSPHACNAGACRPANDTCAGAQTINLSAGSAITLRGSTRFAARELSAPCTEVSGSDVWYRFTLTQRELVYADTIGASFNTVLFFATSCTTPLRIGGENRQVACNDDVVDLCDAGGQVSQVYAVLDPGTYYLVLANAESVGGDATIHFQHLALGAGSVEEFPLGGGFKGLDFLGGALGSTSALRGTCGGDGPEASYWWASCPNDRGGRFVAHTCSRLNIGFNTVLYLRHGDGASEVCNDDNPVCQIHPQSSSLDTMVAPGPGIHALTLDSFDRTGSASTFELRGAYPYFEPQLN